MDLGTKEQAQQEILPNSVAKSPLFKLPAELRNMVYRYAIVTDDRVLINKSLGIPEPGLLSVRKILRSETCTMFHLENKFTCVSRDYDPAAVLLVCRKFQDSSLAASLRKVGSIDVEIHHYGLRNWMNMVAWLHLCHQSACCGLHRKDNASAEEQLLIGLFEIASDGPSITTDALDFLLESVRPALTRLEPGWGKD